MKSQYSEFNFGLGETLDMLREQINDLAAEVEALIEQRATARAAKDWPEADRIRARLTELNVEVMDGPEGARWRLRS